MAWPFTRAANVCVAPAGIAIAAGLRRIPCAEEILSVAVPVRPLLAEDVAVIVTVAGLVGAVNKPALLIEPPPVTLQVNVDVG
jgi:hypothetical protein